MLFRRLIRDNDRFPVVELEESAIPSVCATFLTGYERAPGDGRDVNAGIRKAFLRCSSPLSRVMILYKVRLGGIGEERDREERKKEVREDKGES